MSVYCNFLWVEFGMKRAISYLLILICYFVGNFTLLLPVYWRKLGLLVRIAGDMMLKSLYTTRQEMK